jgi:hypothetical protein
MIQLFLLHVYFIQHVQDYPREATHTLYGNGLYIYANFIGPY